MRIWLSAMALSNICWLAACLLPSPAQVKNFIHSVDWHEEAVDAVSRARNRAADLRYRGNYQAAIEQLSDALVLREQIPQAVAHVMRSKKDIISTWDGALMERGELYVLTGQYQQALDDFRTVLGNVRHVSQAASIGFAPWDPRFELRDRALLAIVRIFLLTGAHDAALLLLDERRRSCGSYCDGELLAALGLALFHKKAYSSARSYTEAGLKRLREQRKLGPDRTLEWNRRDKSLDERKNELRREADRRRYEERDIDLRIADALIVLARLDLVAAGDLTSAEARLAEAASLYGPVLGPSHPAWTALQEIQAGVYHARGIHPQDEHLMRQALSLREHALGAAHVDTLQTQIALARLHMDHRDWNQASALAKQTRWTLERSRNPNALLHCEVLDQLAELAVRSGQPRQALATWQQCLALLIPSPGRQLSFGHDVRARFERSLEILSRAVSLQIQALSAPEDIEVVASMVAHTKNWVTDQMLGTFTRLKASSIGGRSTRKQSAHARELLQELTRLVSTMSTQLYAVQASGTTTRKQMKELRASMQEVEGAMLMWTSMGWELKEDWALTLNIAWDKGWQSSIGVLLQGTDWYKIAKRVLREMHEESKEPRSQPNMAAIRHRLGPGRALLEIFRYQPSDFDSPAITAPRYVAYVLQHEGPVEAIDLGDAATIENLVEQLRVGLSQRRDDVREVGRRLDEHVMAPVRARLASSTVHTIFVASDGYLNLLPLQALSDEDGRYLLESYNFVYLNSSRDLAHPRPETPARNEPIIIANPAFGSPDAPTSGAARKEARARPFYFERLPGTAGEAEDLRELLPSATIWSDVEASETNLKGVQGPQILHLATHGMFLPSVAEIVEQRSRLPLGLGLLAPDPLMRSALAFARANEPAQELHDGIVTALEAALLDLEGTELVVLSGCETGIGDVAHGEAVYGLRQAILLAGARSMVMSLWRVHDEATRQFMRAFYQRLRAGESRENALRDTQLEFIRDEMYSHPSYWGAFVLAGQTGPIALR